MKNLVIVLVMLCVSFSFAQQKRDLKVNKDLKLIEVVYYHDNGTVAQTGFYTFDGKLHGEWFSYCNSGTKLVSAQYKNGKRVGKWFFWENDLLREVDYTNNTIANVSEWRREGTSLASSN